MGSIDRLISIDRLKETFFISHGPPTWCLDNTTVPATQFLRSFRKTVFPKRPSSILVISGHWDTAYPTVNVISSGHNDTMYDFNGFPESTYQLKYPAPGAPNLAKRVKQLLLASGGFDRVDEDEQRGLDHGAWVPLMLMYPDADIPMCQLSIQTDKDATYHYQLGKALAPLKEEGVLILAFGAATHNFDTTKYQPDGSIAPWAAEYVDWLKEALFDRRYEDVNKYEEKGPHAKVVHPTREHFYPLHVAMGAAGENSKAQLIHDSWIMGARSKASFMFTTTDEAN